MRDLDSLYDVARRQGGAVARVQAVRLGFSSRSLATAVQHGSLVVRHPDVFVLAGATSPGTEDWAAYLAGGPGAVLSAWSAARRQGMDWGRELSGEPCITLPTQRHLHLEGVRVLRWRLPPEQVYRCRGVSLTLSARTVVDCLRLGPRHQVEWMLDTALVRRWITVQEFAAQVRTLTGQRGAPMLRDLLTGVASGARSRAERVAQQLILSTGVRGWEWNLEVPLPSGGVAVLDAALPHLRIAVEIDGRAYHVDPDRFQRDRTRQNALVAAGWTVLRFTWWDLTERPDYVVQAILSAVARAS
jgi:very-short-patch-repair endonuclease